MSERRGRRGDVYDRIDSPFLHWQENFRRLQARANLPSPADVFCTSGKNFYVGTIDEKPLDDLQYEHRADDRCSDPWISQCPRHRWHVEAFSPSRAAHLFHLDNESMEIEEEVFAGQLWLCPMTDLALIVRQFRIEFVCTGECGGGPAKGSALLEPLTTIIDFSVSLEEKERYELGGTFDQVSCYAAWQLLAPNSSLVRDERDRREFYRTGRMPRAED